MSDHERAQKFLGPWSFALALKERVEKEAALAWALKEDAPFEPIPDTVTKPWSLPTLYSVFSKIAP
jgi:hypothetical protein